MSSAPGYNESVMDTMAWTVADEYAQGLLDCVGGAGALRVGEELLALVRMVEETDGCRALFRNALLDRADRLDLVQRAFAGRVSDEMYSFLTVLARHGRLGLLSVIARRYQQALNEQHGKVEVVVTTAYPLSDAERDDLTGRIGEMFGIDAILLPRVEPDLLGGIVIQVGDRVYDASIAAELRTMARRVREKVACG